MTAQFENIPGGWHGLIKISDMLASTTRRRFWSTTCVGYAPKGARLGSKLQHLKRYKNQKFGPIVVYTHDFLATDDQGKRKVMRVRKTDSCPVDTFTVKVSRMRQRPGPASVFWRQDRRTANSEVRARHAVKPAPAGMSKDRYACLSSAVNLAPGPHARCRVYGSG